VAIPTLNCEERYSAKFFHFLKITVLPHKKKCKFAKQTHYTLERKSMIRDRYIEMKNVWFKTSAKKLNK